jgi:type IV secretion system protein VirB10
MVINYGGTAYQVALGGMAGVDKRGRAGIAGTLDDHYFEWVKAAGVISFFTLLNSEVMYQTNGQTNPQIRELIDINQGIVNRIGDRLIERALDIQPTVRVANGTAVSVSVNTAMHLKPFPAIAAEEKWIRK